MTAVSVIIPTYNREGWISKAVSSVFDQTFRDYEVIVVDDGSEDGTLDELKVFGDKIRIIHHAENRGVSAARNTGIYSSSAPLIAFLDSDDRWFPDKLKVQVEFFDNNVEAVICQTQEVWFKGGKRVNPAKKHLKKTGDIFNKSLERCLVSPSAVMVRRVLLEEIGVFNERFPVCEDYDLWLRILSKYPIHLIDEEHLIREGGRIDQLSASYPGMDKYRILSMTGLIERGDLSERQETAVFEVMEKKCKIYANGCLKRGKIEEAKNYLNLTGQLREKWCK
jgi:hypothetical protein